MEYEYSPDNIGELLKVLRNDDIVRMAGRDLRKLISSQNAGKGRKPIEIDTELFDDVVRRWQSGEMTARAAMKELGLKPNTFYRRVKERYEDMDELKKEIRNAAKEAKENAEEIVKAHRMEKEIFKEKLSAEIDRKKEVHDLKKEVEAEAEAFRKLAGEE